MFIIVVYDICEDRVVRILKICRKYLNWVQNSVFEGEITKANFVKLKAELEKLLKNEGYRKQMLDNFERLTQRLGGGGASQKTAQLMFALLQS